jgi:hypothetical protein
MRSRCKRFMRLAWRRSPKNVMREKRSKPRFTGPANLRGSILTRSVETCSMLEAGAVPAVHTRVEREMTNART